MTQDSTMSQVEVWDALAPSQDARDLASAARGFFTEWFGPTRMREALEGAPPASTWQKIVDLGLPEIGLPSSAGGDGTLLDCAIMLEEAGRSFLTEPLLSGAMAHATQAMVGMHDTSWVQQKAAFAMARFDGGGSLAADVFDGRDSARLTLVLPEDGGTRVCVIDSADVTAWPMSAAAHIDVTRPWSRLTMPDTHDLPGVSARSEAPLDVLLAPARVAVAADLVGLAAAALESATRHVTQRQQFGQPIGAFQSVKHALADAYVLIERARSLTWGAALEAGGPAPGNQAADLSRLAKAAAADAATTMSRLHVQLLGALGMTFEADSHLFVRRAMQTVPALGSPAPLYASVAADRHTRTLDD